MTQSRLQETDLPASHPHAPAFWGERGCVLLQPYDLGWAPAPATPPPSCADRPRAWNAAYVQPVAPPEGRPLRREPQPPAALLPVPGGAALAAEHPELYSTACARSASTRRCMTSASSRTTGESPTLGAWGLGWEVWLDGMEVTQFTYFQQVGGLDCKPVLGEITYGVERLAMYLQGVENVYDLVWSVDRTVARSPTATFPPERGRAIDVQLRAQQRRLPVLAIHQLRVRGRAPDGGRAGCRPTRWCSRPPTPSTCSTPAARSR